MRILIDFLVTFWGCLAAFCLVIYLFSLHIKRHPKNHFSKETKRATTRITNFVLEGARIHSILRDYMIPENQINEILDNLTTIESRKQYRKNAARPLQKDHPLAH